MSARGVLEPVRRGRAPAGAGARARPLAAADLAPASAVAVLGAVAYLIIAPSSPDLAAADYRAHLFSQVGFSLWDNSWYGGHHLPAYSVLAPGLSALIGARPLAALSMIAASVLFAVAVTGRFPAPAARIGSAWFALGASIALLSSRVPFDLGLALGMGSVVLAQRGRWRGALALAVLTALASPVAGAFLGMAMLAWAIVRAQRGWPAALALASLAPIAVLAVLFPEGGTQPFVGSAFWPALAAVVAIGLALPPSRRELRVGALVYAIALVGAYVLPTAVGGNADRLGALAAGPIAACALLATGTRWRTWALIVLALPLLYWQANAPLADFTASNGDPSVRSSYYRPLLAELRALGVGYGRRPARIEVVATANHWEARWVAPAAMLARGWERQLDRLRNGLFYEEGRLTAARYRSWLHAQSISYVALPDASLDYSAREEAHVVTSAAASGPGGYLREVFTSPHWRLYAVREATPLAQPPALLTAATTQSFTLLAPLPGSYAVRLRFTPYWAVARGSGCVSRAPGGWTLVRARRAERVHVVIRFSLSRILASGPRCS